MTSALRDSVMRLASGGESCDSTRVLPSMARTVAPDSMTSVVRLRSRTLARISAQALRTAVVSSAPG
ncbi:Uncharacterised protein [Mycobacteroides abscessus subsp. abscessus]|nr:Uncharacterised protein [Mycobacteroides abscessus subsp. abscessus]